MKLAQSICLLCLTFSLGMAQRTYEFNREGNGCHFYYVAYTPDGADRPYRPRIFVIAAPGKSAVEAFEEDTLKYTPAFFSYELVYLPNLGKTKSEVLGCVGPLSMVFATGSPDAVKRHFLQVNDTTITKAEVNAAGLRNHFAAVCIAPPPGRLPSIPLDSANDPSKSFILSTPVNTEGAALVNKPMENRVKYTGPPKQFKFTLSGTVKDAQTGEALPFATVVITADGRGTNSNADGSFTLMDVPTDTSRLRVQYLGYEPTTIYLNPASVTKNLVIELVPVAPTMEAVVITTEVEELMKVNDFEVSTITMTPRKTALLPNAGEKDVLRAYQLMPGVSASNESSSGMYVRGGTPDQNLILYDGFVIYHVDHLYGYFSAFNSNALKEIQLHKGGFESKFGGRISSVTEITGKEGNQKKFNIGGDLSLLSLNAYAEVPLGKKVSTIVAFRRSYKGAIYKLIFNKFNQQGQEEDSSSAPPRGPGGAQSQQDATSYFYDLNAKVTYRPSDKDILSLSFFNGTDKLDAGFEMQTPSFLAAQGQDFSFSVTDLPRYGNLGSSLKWARKWAPRLYGTTLLSYSNYYSIRDRSMDGSRTNASGDAVDFSSGINEDNNLKDISLKSDYEWDLFKGNQLQAGLFGTYYDIAYSYSQNDTVSVLNRDDQGILAGAYIQDQWRLWDDRIQIVPGLRQNYFSPTAKWYSEPRLSMIARLSSKISLKAATGRYYQFANRITREDLLSGSKDFWILSDSNRVPVSSAEHYLAGLSVDQGKYLFSVEGYYKQLHDLSEYSLRFETRPNQVSYDENFFVGNGYAKGLEFMAQKKSGNLTGWLSYTLAQVRYKFDVYGQNYFPANQDVTHEFKAVSLYKYKRWNFSATWVYATGRPYTAPSGAYSIDLLVGSQDYFTVTSKNSLRLPDYHRMDLAATYTLLSGAALEEYEDPTAAPPRREIGSLSFSIFNLYNRKNVWYKQYSLVGSSIVSTDITYVGITPNITLSLKLH